MIDILLTMLKTKDQIINHAEACINIDYIILFILIHLEYCMACMHVKT